MDIQVETETLALLWIVVWRGALSVWQVFQAMFEVMIINQMNTPIVAMNHYSI
jgi:hypothetical protein